MLSKEYEWSPGIRQDYKIFTEGKRTVGDLSITRFTIFEPFEMKWVYLNSIKIPEIENRGLGYAYQAMLELNDLIKSEGRNGILKNSILSKNKQDFYRKMGWTKIDGVNKQWEFLMNQELSIFLINKTINLARENFVR